VEHATLSGRCHSLEALIREHSYSTDTVRKLFQSNSLGGGLAPVGTLADFLEVNGEYESVVDEFLRDELNYIVVKSWDSAHEGVRLLKTGVDGRATFLVHPEDSQAKFSFAGDDTLPHHNTLQTIVPLKQLHSSAGRLWTVAGSDSAEAAGRVCGSGFRDGTVAGAGESERHFSWRLPVSASTM
jgi:chromosome segregation ATPase